MASSTANLDPASVNVVNVVSDFAVVLFNSLHVDQILPCLERQMPNWLTQEEAGAFARRRWNSNREKAQFLITVLCRKGDARKVLKALYLSLLESSANNVQNEDHINLAERLTTAGIKTSNYSYLVPGHHV